MTVGVKGYTVEPPNKGQVGAWALVHYLEVVLYWGFFVKRPFLCVVRYNIIISVQISLATAVATIYILLI